MSISAVRLRHFRGIRDASLPLKPLTVLLGPNSAGKSSFGHSLVALKQAHEWPRAMPSLDTPFPGDDERWPIDLGSFQDLRHEGAEGSVEIALQTAAGWIELAFGGRGGAPEPFDSLAMTRYGLPRPPNASPKVSSSPLAVSVTPISVPASAEVPQIGPTLGTQCFERTSAHTWRADGQEDLSLAFHGLELDTVRPLQSTVTLGFPSIAAKSLALFLERLTYLKPSRAAPRRYYEMNSEGKGPNTVGTSGQWTGLYLWSNRDMPVPAFAYPPAPRTPAEAAGDRRSPTEWDETTLPLLEATTRWMRHLGLAASVSSSRDEQRVRLNVQLADARSSRPLTDLGFGLSQVLPVLVAGLSLPQGGRLFVEQPEAQLHPRPQAALADFFCALAKCDRGAIVETHSEAFFHRLRLRVAMDPTLRDLVAVWFVDEPSPNGVCSAPRLVSLDEVDELHWPEGFLSEGLDAELAIRAARTATRKGVGG